MSVARIHRPAKASTTSGLGKTLRWVLEYDAETPLVVEPLMGWTGHGGPLQQIHLWFATCEEAVAYATREGIPYRVEEVQVPLRRQVAYADNFRTDRPEPWTH